MLKTKVKHFLSTTRKSRNDSGELGHSVKRDGSTEKGKTLLINDCIIIKWFSASLALGPPRLREQIVKGQGEVFSNTQHVLNSG